MSVVAPAPVTPPESDELEALIREARARQRRRRIQIAAGVLVAAGLGLALWAAIPTGGSVVHRFRGPVDATQPGRIAPSGLRGGLADVGTSGGVTWSTNAHGFWLTADSGRTWRKLRLPGLGDDPLANIVTVQFVDPRRGWVSALGPRVYRTTDGGRTWHVSVLACSGGCDTTGVSFVDARHGYALVGVRSTKTNDLFRTNDGGTTWQLFSRPLIWGPITFLNDRDGFAGGPGQLTVGIYQGPPIVTLYRTSDGGSTWSRYDIAGSDSFVELPIGVFGGRSIVVQNAPNPAGGLMLRPGAVWSSADDGGHWDGAVLPPAIGVPSSFSAASARFWAFSSGNDLYVTANAGHNWRKLILRDLPPRAEVRKVAFSSPLLGWAIVWGRLPGVAGDSTLIRTTDGGLHWTVNGPPARRPHRHRR